MEISLGELKYISEKILSKVVLLGFDKITINTDLYWCILSSEREDLKKTPAPAVGSLLDDLSSLQLISKKNQEPTINDFDRLANILIAVGEKISKSDKPWLLTE